VWPRNAKPTEVERAARFGTTSNQVECVNPIALSIEDEALGALGETLGDDLRVERVREHLGPVLEQAIGRDAGRAA
jgi:hypothetical protein